MGEPVGDTAEPTRGTRVAHAHAKTRVIAQGVITRRRRPLAPIGADASAAPGTEASEVHVLQKDFLNLVDTPSPGSVEIEVVRDADGGLRFYVVP